MCAKRQLQGLWQGSKTGIVSLPTPAHIKHEVVNPPVHEHMGYNLVGAEVLAPRIVEPEQLYQVYAETAAKHVGQQQHQGIDNNEVKHNWWGGDAKTKLSMWHNGWYGV